MAQQLIETVGLVGTVEEIDDCCHHWMIEAPNGPTSLGTCRDCGEAREFKNSIQITSWESEGKNKNRAAAAAAAART
jgi:hypothetical protein